MNKTPKMLYVEKLYNEDLISLLNRLYVKEQRPTTEISKTLGVSTACVQKWLLKCGVTLRSNSEAKIAQYRKTTVDERKKHTKKANEEFRRKRDAGELFFNRDHLKGDNHHMHRPELREKASKWWSENNPMFNEDSKAKMRRSMERYLRTRATEQELIFKKSIEKLGYFPKFQHAACRAVLDFAFVELKIGIEIDGISHVTFPSTREKDEKRDAELEREGWIILRFFNVEVEDHLGEVLREVIELVELNKAIRKEAS